MLRRFVAFGVLVFGFPSVAKAEAGSIVTSSPALVTIGAIDGESDTKMSIINVRFDKQPSVSQVGELQDHGSFLQLVVPNAIVPEPGKFFDGNNPHLPKIAVFQLTPTDAAIRFFANSNSAAIKRASQAEILGNCIVLTIDHAKLAASAALSTVGSALVNQSPLHDSGFVGPPVPEELRPTLSVTAADVIAKTEVRHDIPAPSDQLKGKLATGGLDLREKLVQVAAFSGVMLILLAISWFVRPMMRRRRAARGELEPEITMKTIASMPLAPRQRVSLIQVGDEKFLIGVTPDAVTFLTSVGKGRVQIPQQMAFARALEEGPSAPMEMRQAPVLKNIEGNDEASFAKATAARASEPRRVTKPVASAPLVPTPAAMKKVSGGRINLTVGEDGVKNLGSRPAPKMEDDGDSQKAIDDVTRMIREKLKTLRTI